MSVRHYFKQYFSYKWLLFILKNNQLYKFCDQFVLWCGQISDSRLVYCSQSPGGSHLFIWCDVQLFIGACQLNVLKTFPSQQHFSDCTGCTFITNKIFVATQIVIHDRIGTTTALRYFSILFYNIDYTQNCYFGT